ncbi:MAG: hypothetical protein J6U27_02020 [Spirochaetales bacterium]|nr:hypothetical protein [Spirochaetales bacterium]MBO7348716.1 hypothetical protein [Spirochaetales bacterium]
MKKIALLAAVLILASGTLCAIDPRLSAMGGIGIAVRGADMQSYPNPASVFFDENRKTFSFHVDVEDTLGERPIPYIPSSAMDINFIADMLTLGIEIDCFAIPRIDNTNVNLFQEAILSFNFSAGYGAFSAGIGVTGGSVQQRLDVKMDSIWDFPVQAYLSPFDRVVNSEYIQVSAGLMAVAGNFSFGMLMSNILERTDSGTEFNFKTLFSHTGFGVYYSRSRYSSRGIMNNFIYSFGVDVDSAFTDDRTINAGAELQFRLVRDSSISARAGYRASFSNFENGTISAGIGVLIRMIEVALNADFPKDEKPRAKVLLTVLF